MLSITVDQGKLVEMEIDADTVPEMVYDTLCALHWIYAGIAKVDVKDALSYRQGVVDLAGQAMHMKGGAIFDAEDQHITN